MSTTGGPDLGVRGVTRAGERAGTPDDADPARPGPVLYFDGGCGFCARSVRFMLRRDRAGTLRFAPLQGVAGRALLARHPALAGVDSVVWVEQAPDGDERVLVYSDAPLRAARHLGGAWALLARAGALVPRPVRDRVYRLIARHRRRLGSAACALPTPEDRARFID